jgi:hypothetical protein
MKAGNIYVFKIVSGEEIIGEIFNTYDTHYDIKNPAVVMLQRTEQGVGVALMPYMPYCEGKVSFYKNSIVAVGEPSQNMMNEYNRLYGSGIQVAPASALAGLQIAS